MPVWLAAPTFAVAGYGMGLAYAPLALIVLREAPTESQGTASSALSLMDTLGTAIGTGVSGAIVAASLRADGRASAPGSPSRSSSRSWSGSAGSRLTGRLRARAHRRRRSVDPGSPRVDPSAPPAAG